MAKLVGDQARTLYEIVRFARKAGWRLPTSREFASIMAIGERAASARMKRLVDHEPDCFHLRGRDKSLNYEMLCTEKETAAAFLKIHELASHSTDGRVAIAALEAAFSMPSSSDFRSVVKMAETAGYFQTIVSNSDEIRLSAKFFSHLEYLKLLVAETNKEQHIL